MSADVYSPRPQRSYKRTLAEIDADAPPISKYARRSLPPLPTPTTHGQRSESRHPPRHLSSGDLDRHCAPPKKRRRLQASLPGPTGAHQLQVTRSASAPPWPAHGAGSKPCRPQLSTVSPLDAWILAVHDIDSRPSSAPGDRPEPRPATINLSKQKPTPLSQAAIQQMSQQQSQYAETVGPKSTASNKTPTPGDPEYIDTLYSHGIILDLSGRKIPPKLAPFKDEILKKRSSPQLDDRAVDVVMDVAEDLAYTSEGPTNKILRTPMFPLAYGDLAEGGNAPWNTVAMPNNPECTYKLSAPKPDTFLAYPRGPKTLWTVKQNNVANHPKLRPFPQPAKRNTFPSISFELKAESAGGVLTTVEAQAAGSGSHMVNSMLWVLENAKEAGLTEVDLMQDTVSFSVVASHRQVVVYLHWHDPEEKHYYMSYLRSYSTFEAESIRACNNTIKNAIDYAKGPRRILIGKALVTLVPTLRLSNPQPVATNPQTPSTSFSGDSRPRKRGRDWQVE